MHILKLPCSFFFFFLKSPFVTENKVGKSMFFFLGLKSKKGEKFSSCATVWTERWAGRFRSDATLKRRRALCERRCEGEAQLWFHT